MDAAIQKAQEKIAFVSSDEEMLNYYRLRERALSDFTSGMNFARREGKAEGLAEGKAEGLAEGKAEGLAEGKKELVRNMKAGGLSVEQIMTFSGLSRKEIEEL